MLGSDNDDLTSTLRTSIPVRLSRYDILLAVIPAAFLLALVAGTFLSTPPQASLVAASLVGVLAVIDGLFRNPPTVGSGR